ncbi:MAG: RNA-binding transcriptional accessory protein [Candidatus Hydrogenedentes bacterium]|nr:RNA-binding transcriptional accessory protein [Candidatus Hydrogenedentota bacterium]
MIEAKFIEVISKDLGVSARQTEAAIALFDKGSTVPFVARYRKDVTGNLNEVQLEHIESRNVAFTALINRRDAILENIAKQGKLTPELREQIRLAQDQTTLEDLYLPFKKQRRTKATIAREQGLEPLADIIWNREVQPEPISEVALRFIDSSKGVSTPEEALDGAHNIIAERISLHADTRRTLRNALLEQGVLVSAATKLAAEQKTKFEAYYAYSEPMKSIPSHRLLAVLRGVRMGFLSMDLTIDDEAMVGKLNHLLFGDDPAQPYADLLRAALTDAYKRLLRPSIENEAVILARTKADEEAIRVFRENAGNLLMAPPAGMLAVMGVDPGIRTGSKLAVVDETGAYRESATIYPGEPQHDEAGAEKALVDLMERYNIQAFAIGNGTGSREVAKFINDVLRKLGKKDAFTVFVNEAGASIYSASKTARDEFPDLDITIRGAISIARRLQDPLAELVKLEPRNIGVGQYQHDVNQKSLREGLYRTVELCVNLVGVNLNTASVELLRYISGIQMGTAQNIVEFRNQHGPFKSRAQLHDVAGIGEKTFEQCAGFLRIADGENPLDSTAIHPETYPVVEQISASLNMPVAAIIAKPELIQTIKFEVFSSELVGQFSLADIREELLKPGRDPRQEFKVPHFLDGVGQLEDLEKGMVTEGVVTNVTDFGAFVDIGVHQDGLVHLSELANRFVKDPSEIVQVGQIIKVKVIDVDKDLRRISLSMKALQAPAASGGGRRRPEQRTEDGAAPAAQTAPREEAPRGDRPQRTDRPEGSERQDRPRQDDRPRRDDRPRQGGGGRGGQQGGRSKPNKKGRGGDDRRPQQAPPAPKDRKPDNMNTALADQLAAMREQLLKK